MKIRKKSILSLMLILGFLTAQSQFATLRGTVYEKETGEPSFGTNVKIKGTGTSKGKGFHVITSLNVTCRGKSSRNIHSYLSKS